MITFTQVKKPIAWWVRLCGVRGQGLVCRCDSWPPVLWVVSRKGFPHWIQTYLPCSQALLQLRLSEDTILAVVGLPRYFSPVTGPVVWTTKARHDPLAWNRHQNLLWFSFYGWNYSLQGTLGFSCGTPSQSCGEKTTLAIQIEWSNAWPLSNQIESHYIMIWNSTIHAEIKSEFSSVKPRTCTKSSDQALLN